MAIQYNDTVRSLAFLYMRYGYNRRAKSLFELLVRAEQADVCIYLSLGSVLVKSGYPKRALKLLGNSHGLEWSDDAIRFRSLVVSEALQALGHIPEAREEFARYLNRKTQLNLKAVS